MRPRSSRIESTLWPSTTCGKRALIQENKVRSAAAITGATGHNVSSKSKLMARGGDSSRDRGACVEDAQQDTLPLFHPDRVAVPQRAADQVLIMQQRARSHLKRILRRHLERTSAHRAHRGARIVLHTADAQSIQVHSVHLTAMAE